MILRKLSLREMSRCRQEIKIERNDFLSVSQILWTYHSSTSNIIESTWCLACKECGLPFGKPRRLRRHTFFINYKRNVMKYFFIFYEGGRRRLPPQSFLGFFVGWFWGLCVCWSFSKRSCWISQYLISVSRHKKIQYPAVSLTFNIDVIEKTEHQFLSHFPWHSNN